MYKSVSCLCTLARWFSETKMLREVVLFAVFALCLVNVYCASVSNVSSSEEEQKNILESIKEFVRTVEKYNLNVSVIGSANKYRPSGKVKESVSLILHMPVNDVFLTEATLDAGKQEKYLTKLEKIASKENVAAKTRVIPFKNTEDTSVDEQIVNSEYLIDSPSYDSFARYKNGKTVFDDIENHTSIVFYNYIINNVSDHGVKNVQVITANVIISEKDVTDDFPAEVLDEIKQVLPRFWLSIESPILPRLLVEHLDKKFSGNFQVLIGAGKFALGGKPYAYLDVGDTNVVVFSLA